MLWSKFIFDILSTYFHKIFKGLDVYNFQRASNYEFSPRIRSFRCELRLHFEVSYVFFNESTRSYAFCITIISLALHFCDINMSFISLILHLQFIWQLSQKWSNWDKKSETLIQPKLCSLSGIQIRDFCFICWCKSLTQICLEIRQKCLRNLCNYNDEWKWNENWK